jgi:hypothetical protein
MGLIKEEEAFLRGVRVNILEIAKVAAQRYHKTKDPKWLTQMTWFTQAAEDIKNKLEK